MTPAPSPPREKQISSDARSNHNVAAGSNAPHNATAAPPADRTLDATATPRSATPTDHRHTPRSAPQHEAASHPDPPVAPDDDRDDPAVRPACAPTGGAKTDPSTTTWNTHPTKAAWTSCASSDPDAHATPRSPDPARRSAPAASRSTPPAQRPAPQARHNSAALHAGPHQPCMQHSLQTQAILPAPRRSGLTRRHRHLNSYPIVHRPNPVLVVCELRHLGI